MDASEVLPFEDDEIALPTIWLLGRAGAGKSSIISAITGSSEIEIGNGFEPCGRHSLLYRYPADQPVIQFMDTAGIGERGFDPAAELAGRRDAGQVVLAVVRVDDPATADLCDALRSIADALHRIRISVIHSRADAIADPKDREQARIANHRSVEIALGRRLPQVEVSLLGKDGENAARCRILDLLGKELPLAAFLLERNERRDFERAEFLKVKNKVARHSLRAAAAAMIPVAGIPAEMAIQARMLAELASTYDVRLSRKVLIRLGSTLGAGLIAGRAVSIAARQAGLLIPVAGQVAGPALSGIAAFGFTFAIGRASSHYFHELNSGRPPDKAKVRQLYRSALRSARQSFRSQV